MMKHLLGRGSFAKCQVATDNIHRQTPDRTKFHGIVVLYACTWIFVFGLQKEVNIYRLTHSASELSGFTCPSSLTMNEKFQYRTRPPSAVLKNFEFIVSERVQVNPDNSRAMSALTFLLFKLNTLQAKIVKF